MSLLATTEGPGPGAPAIAVYRCDVCLCRQTHTGPGPLGLPPGWRAVAPHHRHLCPVCLRRAESDLTRQRHRLTLAAQRRRGTPA